MVVRLLEAIPAPRLVLRVFFTRTHAADVEHEEGLDEVEAG